MAFQQILSPETLKPALAYKVNSLIVWYYHATLSSGSRPHNQMLWESGALRCVLITTKNPETFTVHVFHGDSLVCMERCEKADDVAVVAERLRQFLADRDSCPHCKSPRLTRVGLVTNVTYFRCDDCNEVFKAHRPDW